jgi:hypothetical protein
MDMVDIVSYLVVAMTAWVPLRVQPELKEEAMARYESIARSAADVAEDEAEEPLFAGPGGRTQTALLLLSVASMESGYRSSVDEGLRRGDDGQSFCLMQLRVGSGTTAEGWSGDDLVRDRTRCFRAALHVLRGSFNVCRSLPIEDRMSAYATGQCRRGEEASRARVGRALAWWAWHPRLA